MGHTLPKTHAKASVNMLCKSNKLSINVSLVKTNTEINCRNYIELDLFV